MFPRRNALCLHRVALDRRPHRGQMATQPDAAEVVRKSGDESLTIASFAACLCVRSKLDFDHDVARLLCWPSENDKPCVIFLIIWRRIFPGIWRTLPPSWTNCRGCRNPSGRSRCTAFICSSRIWRRAGRFARLRSRQGYHIGRLNDG